VRDGGVLCDLSCHKTHHNTQ